MSILNCYLYNTTVAKVEDIRCENKEKCEGCIFCVRNGDKDGEENQS